MACKPLARHASRNRQSAGKWCDRATAPPQLEASMTFLLPGERIDGTAAECAHLRLLLACFRASPPPMRLPEVSGRPLPAVLESGVIDRDVFSAGHAIMVTRYEGLGTR